MKEKILNALKVAGSSLLLPFKWIKTLKKPVKIALCLILAVAIAFGGFTVYKKHQAKKTASSADAGTSVVRK